MKANANATVVEFPTQISVLYDPTTSQTDILHTVSSPFTLAHALNQHMQHPAATGAGNGDWALGDAQNFEVFLGVRTWYDRAGSGARMATLLAYRDGDAT
jgi:hypothetical protein